MIKSFIFEDCFDDSRLVFEEMESPNKFKVYIQYDETDGPYVTLTKKDAEDISKILNWSSYGPNLEFAEPKKVEETVIELSEDDSED